MRGIGVISGLLTDLCKGGKFAHARLKPASPRDEAVAPRLPTFRSVTSTARDVPAGKTLGPTTVPVSPRDTDATVEACYDAMVRRHYSELCRFAYRYVSSRDAAEDVVHEVLLKIWERAAGFDYAQPLPYLYQATRNRALSHLRHQRVHDRWEATATNDAAARMRSGEPDASHAVAAADLAVAIAKSVDSLPERCRAVFTLHRERGMSYSEIARTLGITTKTVENQMGRALKMLRRQLAPFLSVAILVGGTALTR